MKWSAVFAAGAVVGCLAVAYALLGRYQPLVTAAVAYGDLSYRDGEQTFYSITLRNGGRLPVRISRLNLESRSTPLLVRTQVRLGRTLHDSTPFTPFTLRRGASRTVVMIGRFDNCGRFPFGVATRREVQRVYFRVLGLVGARQDVQLRTPIEIDAPADARCSARASGSVLRSAS
jgi:hypothetical protein